MQNSCPYLRWHVCLYLHFSPSLLCPFSGKAERLGIPLTRCVLFCLCTYADSLLLSKMCTRPLLTRSSCQNLVCHFFPATVLVHSSSVLSKHFSPRCIMLNLSVSMFYFSLYWCLQDMVVICIFASPHHHEMCMRVVLGSIHGIKLERKKLAVGGDYLWTLTLILACVHELD